MNMSSSSSSEDDGGFLFECIAARENAFRDYFSHCNIRSEPSHSRAKWDSVLDPPTKSPLHQFKPFSAYVKGLYHLSSQLTPKHMLAFHTEYPLGRGTAVRFGEPSSRPPKYERYMWNDNNEYDAKADAACLINEIDSATLKSSNIEYELFHAAGGNGKEQGDQEGKGAANDLGINNGVTKITHDRKVASLQYLAGQSLQSAMVHRACQEENVFVDSLYNTVQSAERRFQNAIENRQQCLQESEEAQEVKRLRLLLYEAEKNLMNKQKSIQKELEQARDAIQEDLDRDRANLTVDYLKKREGILAVDPAVSICRACLKAFSPQSRSSLCGWERCSVAACSSREKLCPDCSTTPCGRCFAPLCSIHHGPHELVCNEKCKDLCGFNTDKKVMELNSGCCGLSKASLACYICSVNICDRCTFEDESLYETLCPQCFGKAKDSDKRAILWSASEYETERKRLKKMTDARSSSPWKYPPLARLSRLPEKLKKAQQDIHQQWIKERVEQPTEQEYEWVEAHYQNLVGDLSDESSWFGTSQEEMKLQSLQEGGKRNFSKWIKSEGAEKEVINIITERYDDLMDDEHVVPDTVCPCEECKSRGIRAELERERAKANSHKVQE